MIEFEYVKDIIIKNKFAIIAFLFGVISIVGSIFYVSYNKQDVLCSETKVVTEAMSEKPKEVIEDNPKIKVDVKGAVKKPNVYEFSQGSTVMDAITAAGGLTSTGSTANINLSKKLTDEMVIYVFTKNELKKRETANEVVCEIPKCECETITVNECTSNVNGNTSNETSQKPENKSDEKNDNQSSTTTQSKVSLNKGTVEDFTTLDGIGESKAKAIVEYRNTNGPFEKIEDIMNVSGIGEKAFEKIKDRLTL